MDVPVPHRRSRIQPPTLVQFNNHLEETWTFFHRSSPCLWWSLHGLCGRCNVIISTSFSRGSKSKSSWQPRGFNWKRVFWFMKHVAVKRHVCWIQCNWNVSKVEWHKMQKRLHWLKQNHVYTLNAYIEDHKIGFCFVICTFHVSVTNGKVLMHTHCLIWLLNSLLSVNRLIAIRVFLSCNKEDEKKTMQPSFWSKALPSIKGICQ